MLQLVNKNMEIPLQEQLMRNNCTNTLTAGRVTRCPHYFSLLFLNISVLLLKYNTIFGTNTIFYYYSLLVMCMQCWWDLISS